MDKMSFFADGLRDYDELMAEIDQATGLSDAVSAATGSSATASTATIESAPLEPEAMDTSANDAASNSPSPAVVPLLTIPPTTPSPKTSPVTEAPPSTNSYNYFRCKLCDGRHPLRFCEKFLKYPLEKRHRVVISHGHCTRCLARSHLAKDCRSKSSCRICNDKHHTLLHDGPKTTRTQTESRPANKHRQTKKSKVRPQHKSDSRPSEMVSQSTSSNAVALGSLPLVGVVSLSPSVVVRLSTPTESILVRAIIDQCARQSQVCTSLVRDLRLPCSQIDGIAYSRFTITSTYDPAQSVTVTARVNDLAHVSTPAEAIPEKVKESYIGLPLADPHFYIVGRVVLVLGPELYTKVMTSRIQVFPGLPMAQYSIFGWVLSGVYTN
ncbi:uncharacterized protein [Musca autumnalis]|uniref:uncharacterized protein n=1 Tax=Musca autumnalis TaxID=221902 RepID=UPI003CEAFBF8